MKSIDSDSTFHSNQSYKIFEGVEWSDLDFSRSLFNGTVISDSLINGAIFDNADFEAAKFLKVEFRNCSFRSTGIRSIMAVNCIFEKCDFDDSSLNDSSFASCSFDSCLFSGAVVKECMFEDNCMFSAINTKNSEFMLNTYRGASFKHSQFDNTYYYQIFDDCHFSDVIFEAYLLGYTYGLNEKNLEQIELRLMEKPISNAIGNIFDNLKTLYLDRGMFINLGLLQLYESDVSVDYSIINCISFIDEYIKRDILIKTEELLFIQKIVDELSHTGKPLLPITSIILYQKFMTLLEGYDNSAIAKARPSIISLRNSFHYSYLEYIDSLEPILATDYKSAAEVKLRYMYEPSVSLADILNDISLDHEPTYRINSQTGSFIEWLSCPPSAMDSLGVFLSLLGVVTPVIKKAKNNKKISNPTKENLTIAVLYEFNDGINKTKQSISISLPKGTDCSRYVGVVQSAVVSILDNNILQSRNLCGYNNENIKEVNVKAS